MVVSLSFAGTTSNAILSDNHTYAHPANLLPLFFPKL